MVRASGIGPPAPNRCAGGGEAARLEDDPLTRGRSVGAVVVGDAHAPTRCRGGTVDRDVTTERDERAAAGGAARRLGGPVGGQRLGGGAEVERHTRRYAHGSGGAV